MVIIDIIIIIFSRMNQSFYSSRNDGLTVHTGSTSCCSVQQSYYMVLHVELQFTRKNKSTLKIEKEVIVHIHFSYVFKIIEDIVMYILKLVEVMIINVILIMYNNTHM